MTQDNRMELDHPHLDSDFDIFAFKDEAKSSPGMPGKCLYYWMNIIWSWRSMFTVVKGIPSTTVNIDYMCCWYSPVYD